MTGLPALTIGVEEEYLLVDPDSRDLVSDPPASLLAEAEVELQSQVSPEFLRSQIETGTRVCSSLAEVRDEVRRLRSVVSGVADRHDMGLIAASTHPFADWSEQLHTDRQRYRMLAKDLQVVARRLAICGMHVHIGIEDEDLRIDLMNQITYFLPHLLAISGSSPFWQGFNTGLKSYRLSVFDSLPRTGLPHHFNSWGEYQRHVDVLVAAGVIEDASKLWWDIRPSARYPTIEMRIADIPTRLDDVITIAAMYACLLRMLYRMRLENRRWREYSSMLVAENRWRAQRYGFSESLVDFGVGSLVPYADLLEEILELVAEDAAALECEAELENAREILRRGTSADRQVAVYTERLAAGEDEPAALRAVVDMLIEDTLRGV